jgi:hypothetical protein
MQTKPYDKIEQIANDSQIAVAIIGNPRTGDFELLDLKVPCSEERRLVLVGRGMFFCGISGIVNGVPQTSLETPLDNTTVDAVAAAFLVHIEQNIDLVLRGLVEQKALEGWLARLSTDDCGHA